MESKSARAVQIPKIDFSRLDPTNPGSHGWDAVQGQVMQALESHGCFEAVYDRVTPELREALFGPAMGELFGLPLETKMRSTSEMPFGGYVGNIPGMPYESHIINDAPSLDASERFTSLMWPDGGNPTFCNTVWSFAKHMQELEQMVLRMVSRSMGVEKHYNSLQESSTNGLRLSEYGVPTNQTSKLAMDPHTDPNYMTIICQHQTQGLEIQDRKSGEWIPVLPFPNSFTVMIGESLRAWSNGRLKAAYHRVKMERSEKRYTTVFGKQPREGYTVGTPEELVDEAHPLLFKPYDLGDYMRFRFSTAGTNAKDALMAFCGVVAGEKDVMEA